VDVVGVAIRNKKHRILELRELGKTYNEIVKIVGCSKGLVSYHCGEGQKEKTNIRRKKQHPFSRKLYRFISKDNRCSGVKKTTSKSKAIHLLWKKVNWFIKQRKNSELMCDNPFTIEDVINKFGQNTTCYLTGEPIDIYQTSTYEFDHIIPRSRGGSNELDNLGLCSKRVNRAKTNMTVDEFVGLCRLVVNHYDNKN